MGFQIMGFLSKGETLSWDESIQYLKYIKDHGIKQFIEMWRRDIGRVSDCLKFGDEIEYYVVTKEDGKYVLSLRGGEILKKLQEDEDAGKAVETLWRPEYGAFMIEGTPGKPYGDCVSFFGAVEDNMRYRRRTVQGELRGDEALLSLTVFPQLGSRTHKFVEDVAKEGGQKCALVPGGPIAESQFTPDEIINPHRRFGTLTRNIRHRRGENVRIRIPLFADAKTDMKVADEAGKSGCIYMDSMASGMGLCCLQCTFQCVDVDEARSMYDALAVLAPVMMAVSAASPFQRGFLADRDSRWEVIAASVDCRTPAERGEAPLDASKPCSRFRIPKSRYGHISCYLSRNHERKWDDAEFPVVPEYEQELLDADVDPVMARHIAHLFVRDPMVIYNDRIELNDAEEVDHFENIQSTNWQTVRFKPPPPNQASIGWRVEFRTLEAQLSDYSSAAFVIFVVIVTRVILSFGLQLYIPISKSEENLRRAQERDSVLNQRFFFRRDAYRICCTSRAGLPETYSGNCGCDEHVVEMTVAEILCGRTDEFGDFPGLISVMERYLNAVNIDVFTRAQVRDYMELVRKRACGELQTPARWQREFITSHPDYKQDSVISDSIATDLIDTIRKINDEQDFPEKLFGSHRPMKNHL